jgi:DNA-binding PadR family transcriptional regulator
MPIRHGLLVMLSRGPRHGYQLRVEFEASTGAIWPLNVGQVYTTLQRLERDGLVASEGDGERSRKRYAITTAGSEELAGWLRTPPELVPPPRDELVIKVLVAARVPGVDVHDVIQVHRRHLVELMQQWTRIKEDAGDHEVGLVLAVDAELFRLDSVIRWLDTAGGRFARIDTRRVAHPPSPAPAPMPRRRRRVGSPR